MGLQSKPPSQVAVKHSGLFEQEFNENLEAAMHLTGHILGKLG